VFHIHDGYVLWSEKRSLHDVVKSGRVALESSSEFFDGLRLSVSCSIGKNLNEMKRVF